MSLPRVIASLARRCSVLEVRSDAFSTACTATQNRLSRAFGDNAASKSSAGKSKWGTTSIGQVMKEKAESGAPTASLFFCAPTDTVFEAVKKMAAANVGSIVVLKGEPTANDSVAGIITERDYMRNVVVAGKSSKDMECRSLMTPVSKLITLQSNNSMLEAMNMMEEYNIRHIPIIDNGTLQGMLSIKDVVATLINEHNAEVDSMAEYIGGSY